MNQKDKTIHYPHQLNIETEEPWNRLNINLDRIISNYQQIKSIMPTKSFFYAVVKSDAYGHGIRIVAKTLSEIGCKHFAVESPHEGIALRNEKIRGEILLLNPIPEWMSELCIRYNLSVSVIHPSILPPLENAAKKLKKNCKIHLNLNVGLNRLGIAPSKLLQVAKETDNKPHLQFEGLFAQPRGPSNALHEYNILKENHKKLVTNGIKPKYIHFANSTVFLAHPETITDGARLGILLYGVFPPEQYGKKNQKIRIKPVMDLTSELVQIRHLPKGAKIGYRSNQKTERDSLIGTIPIGYSHGIGRKAAKDGHVLIKQRKAPFFGTISMNSSTIDITDIPNIKIGNKVTIVGRQGKENIDINELAMKSGTIGAELMMLFGRGITRNYKMNNQLISTKTTIKQPKKQNIQILYYKTVKELPEWIDFFDIVSFLKKNLKPFDDPEETINSALDYALSSHSYGGGFVLVALLDKKIIAAAVCVQMDKVEFVPENLLVYLCVHRNHRKMGLGTKMFNKVIQYTNGNIKLHLEKSNPALRLCKKMGFKTKYLEMRLEKREETNE